MAVTFVVAVVLQETNLGERRFFKVDESHFVVFAHCHGIDKVALELHLVGIIRKSILGMDGVVSEMFVALGRVLVHGGTQLVD